jgi:hypothetical protein
MSTNSSFQLNPATATVRRTAGLNFEVVTGHRRLQAALEVHGRAYVEVGGTDEVMQVHEANGELVAVPMKPTDAHNGVKS